MNGRVYDPMLGRFLSADPHIQLPYNTQSYNRYSYVQNNPMKYADPSGYFFKSLFKGIGKLFKKILKNKIFRMVAAAVAAWYLGPEALKLGWYEFAGGAIAQGAMAGAVAGFSAGFIASGGDFKAALYGGLSGAAFGAVGASSLGSTAKVAAHGVVGGISSKIQGGKFGEGFISSAFAKFTSMKIRGLESLDKVGKGIATAIAGGTASVIGGGKFANGATRAALAYIVNEASWDSDSELDKAVKHLSGYPKAASALMQIDKLMKQGDTVREAMQYVIENGSVGEYKELFESLATHYDTSPRDFSSPYITDTSANMVQKAVMYDSLFKAFRAEGYFVKGIVDEASNILVKRILVANRVPNDVADLIVQGKNLEGDMESLKGMIYE